MSEFRRALDDYLELRRALGFKLERPGALLADFIGYVDRAGADYLTTELALRWAMQPAVADPSWWATRLGAVRVFARHLSSIDPRTEVPPPDLLVGRSRRARAYLYSPADIAALIAAARTIGSPLKAATYETVIGLLFVTGMRVGEVIGLDREDVHRGDGVLVVRGAKFGKSREVALHATTLDALDDYAHVRARFWPRPSSPAFFLSTTGTRLLYKNVHYLFHRLVDQAGLARGSHRPRPHDLRHTFAVNTLLGWYRAGVDVEAHLPELSTYLGHVAPGSTYWYLSAAPELLGLAAERMEQAQGPRP